MGKTMGIGSSALKGAGIGMMLGPVGAAVGGLIGGIYGAITEFNKPSPGVDNTGSIGMKHGGLITEPIEGVGLSGMKYSFGEDGVNERVTPVGKNGPGNNGGGGKTSIDISFKTPLTIKAEGGVSEEQVNEIVMSSMMLGKLGTAIKMAMSSNGNGGVLNPNPS